MNRAKETLRPSVLRITIPLTAVLAAFGIGACGGASDESGGVKRGGTLTILDVAGGIDSLDPGYWYYQTDYAEVFGTTHRALYGWKPDERSRCPTSPGSSEVSKGGKTVTSRSRGVKYSAAAAEPQVRQPTSSTRSSDLSPQVGNGYANVYYGDIEGVKNTRTARPRRSPASRRPTTRPS